MFFVLFLLVDFGQEVVRLFLQFHWLLNSSSNSEQNSAH